MKKPEENANQTEMREAIDGNLSEEHGLSTVAPSSVAKPNQFKSVGIQGMEDIPTSLIAIPYCRLVQPSSKKTEDENGQEVPAGNFLFNDTQKAVPELNFILLRSKHEFKLVDESGQFVPEDYPGVTRQKQQVSILGITTDTEKLFILSLSPTSFSAFGRLIAKFKDMKVDKTWRFVLKATTEKVENAKGKFYVLKLDIGQELQGEELERMDKTAMEYGLALDRQVDPEE